MLHLLAVLTLGVVLYSVCDSPLLATLIPAIHASWNSFGTARWLLRVDPWRPRAWVCTAFFVAHGFWNAAAGAFCMVLAIIGSTMALRLNLPDLGHFIFTMLTLIASISIAALLGLAGSVCAVRYGIRIWVSPGLRNFLQEDFSKRIESPFRPFNRAIFVLGVSIAFPILSSICLILVDQWIDAAAPAILFAGPIIEIFTYRWFSARIIAGHPSECWG